MSQSTDLSRINYRDSGQAGTRTFVNFNKKATTSGKKEKGLDSHGEEKTFVYDRRDFVHHLLVFELSAFEAEVLKSD